MVVSLEAIKDLIRGFAKTGLWPDEICESVSRYLARKRAVKLPLRARIALFTHGYWPVLTAKTNGWGPITFCLVKCGRHGLVVDYPHGHKGYFRCPLCG